MNLKITNYKNKKFSLSLPFGWKVLRDDKLYSFYTKESSGAIQISTYTQNISKINLLEKLRNFMNDSNMGKVTEKSKGKYDYVEKSFIKNKFFTYVRIISFGHYFALITYNCQDDNLDRTYLEMVKKIFDSFEFIIKKKSK